MSVRSSWLFLSVCGAVACTDAPEPGRGVLVLESSTVDFGAVQCGAFGSQVVVARNDGDARLVTTVAATLPGIAVSTTDLVLEPGERREITLAARVPDVSIPGHVSRGDLTFTDDGGAITAQVPLAVTAHGAILRHAAHVDFGTMFPGTLRGRDLALTVEGTASLRVTLGAVPAPFRVNTLTAYTLAPGATGVLGFVLETATPIDATHEIALAVDGPLCAPLPAAPVLRAIVDDGLLSLDRTTIDFGTVRCGPSHSIDLRAEVDDGLAHTYFASFLDGDSVRINGIDHATDFFRDFTTRLRGTLGSGAALNIPVTVGALHAPGIFLASDVLSITVDGVVTRKLHVTADLRRPLLHLPFSRIRFLEPFFVGDTITTTFEVVNEGNDLAPIAVVPSPRYTASPSSFIVAPGETGTVAITVPVTATTQFPLDIKLGDGCGAASGATYTIEASITN